MPKDDLPEGLLRLLGYRTDREIATLSGVSTSIARGWRTSRGISARCGACGKPHEGGCGPRQEFVEPIRRTRSQILVDIAEADARMRASWESCLQHAYSMESKC